MHQARNDPKLIGQLRRSVTEEAQNVWGSVERVSYETAVNFLQRMQAVLEPGCDAEVAAAPTKRPEQLGVAVTRHRQDVARGSHPLNRPQAVIREPVHA